MFFIAFTLLVAVIFLSGWAIGRFCEVQRSEKARSFKNAVEG